MRTICIGDIHGCVDEFRDLLHKVDFRRGIDELILVGDLIDRGPDSAGVVALAMELEALTAMGNHEDKALRYLSHEQRKAADPRYRNPMRADESKVREWKSLTEQQVRWLTDASTMIDHSSGWLFVHAGFEARPLDRQSRDRVIRVRYIDQDGRMVPFKNDSMDQPEGTRWWTQGWTSERSVCYGHSVRSLHDPVVERNAAGAQMVALDTGCCFGGRLTAMVIQGQSIEFQYVQARRAYVEPRNVPTG